MLTGGCFCGAVRYQVAGGTFDSTLCHCSDCRRVAAAPMVAWFTALPADFHITAGTPKRFRSSPRAQRQFCPECGTGLTYQHDHLPNEIDITTCSLDTPEQMPPADHTWDSERLPWIKLADGLAVHGGFRSD